MLAVIRPADPAKALAAAKALVGTPGDVAQDKLNEMLAQQMAEQEYTFRGIATTDGRTLLDHTGAPIQGDEMQPGDSFVPYDQVLQAMHPEPAP